MQERHTVIPRTLCFIFFEDQVLLNRSSEKKEWAGIYNPVGGHIEKGEDIIESAEREIFEETGLRVTDTELKGVIHVTNFYKRNTMIFITSSNAQTKEVKSSDEGELIWVDLENTAKLNVFEDFKPILQAVLKNKGTREVFTGKSEFSDENKLLRFEIK